jgi:hypothetical protein
MAPQLPHAGNRKKLRRGKRRRIFFHEWTRHLSTRSLLARGSAGDRSRADHPRDRARRLSDEMGL